MPVKGNCRLGQIKECDQGRLRGICLEKDKAPAYDSADYYGSLRKSDQYRGEVHCWKKSWNQTL